MSNSRTASSELSAAASLMRSELCEAVRQLAAALAMASTLWIVIEPLLRFDQAPAIPVLEDLIHALPAARPPCCRARAARFRDGFLHPRAREGAETPPWPNRGRS